MKEVEHDKQFEDGPVEDEILDPTSPEYAPGLSLIVLMRIYEVQLAMLREVNPEGAGRLLELHEKGIISTPMPWIDPETMNK